MIHEQKHRRLINLKEVVARTGLSRSVIYARMTSGTFPRSVSLGAATVRWVDEEVDQWIDAQIRARDEAFTQPPNLDRN
jgi:prophage regulatory protein